MIPVLLFAILLQFSTFADTLNNEDVIYYTDSGYAEFASSVPLHSFTGESDHLTGMIDLEENIVDFYLDLNTLKTGIDRRDQDMYETLNVNEYPFAEFTGSIQSDFDAESTEPQQVVVEGEFTVHGETREINIEGQMQMQDNRLHLEAEWILLLEDYNIEPPGILFYRVNDEQEIRIEAELTPQPRDEFSDSN